MDYTDIYLRHRKKDNVVTHQNSKSAEVGPVCEQRVECVLKGAFSVQQLFDRIETLSARVDSFDEKLLNLTKLVKLAQNLQEEKETDLRRQQHELRSRLKRQEQTTAKLLEELAALREKVPHMIQEAVKDVKQENMNDVMKASKQNEKELCKMKLEVEGTLGDIKRDLEQDTMTLRKENSTTLEQQLAAQSSFREQLSTIEKTLQLCKLSVETNETTRLMPLETAMQRMTEVLGSLEQKIDAVSNKAVTVEEEGERIRGAIMDELESTREWATRNLQRVKQHVEVISTDVMKLQNEQRSITSCLNRVSCQADVECKKLRNMLLQKTREADALGSIMGKELGKVENMAERHQALRTESLSLKGMVF